jgi:hypothetical protein
MVDRYTKLVLTVIAACLVWNIVAASNDRRALAQSGPQHVVVDQWGMYPATLPIPVVANVSSPIR